MVNTISIDLNEIYKKWRLYLIAHSDASHFGMVYDASRQSQFPYANLKLIGRPKNGGDLEGDEVSISITFETEAYVNDNKYLTLYAIDSASADFFKQLGFDRVGDTNLVSVSGTVTKVVSRFTMLHYCGYFLKELNQF